MCVCVCAHARVCVGVGMCARASTCVRVRANACLLACVFLVIETSHKVLRGLSLAGRHAADWET